MTREEALQKIAEIGLRPFGLFIRYDLYDFGPGLCVEVYDENINILQGLNNTLGGMLPPHRSGLDSGKTFLVFKEDRNYAGAYALIVDLKPYLAQVGALVKLCAAGNAIAFWKREQRKAQKHFEKLHPLP